MITVAIADDQPMIRTAVREILKTAADIDVVAEARDGNEAVSLAQELKPDVLLMDIRMPQLDGIAATRQICTDRVTADVHVLILTTFEEDAFVLDALRAGASGFIGKGCEPGELIAAIRIVSRGEQMLSPTATHSLIKRFIGAPSQAAASSEALKVLTAREREILSLVGRGHSNQQIGTDLYVSPLTVKTHISRIMAKLAAHDRAQLVVIAYETGLLRN